MSTLIGLSLALLSVLFARDWSNFWENLIRYLVFSHVIGGMAAMLIPPLALRLCRMGVWRRWPLFIAALAALGASGAFVSCCVLVLVGLEDPARFRAILIGSSALASLITIIVGSATNVVMTLRGRLERTTLDLRTQQLERERVLKLAAEARLGALQSRLQPHFLFNTMNSILALIEEDPRAAQQMLERLSHLLRFALDAQARSVIPLREELRLVEDYLEIERTRFGSRLRFRIDVPPELGTCEVPPYSLQTLVENSVKYAVSPRRDGGEVVVSARRDGDRLRLEVGDDGPGFSRAEFAPGHGLDTLEQRLTAVYGERGSLTLENGTGARVQVTVPA